MSAANVTSPDNATAADLATSESVYEAGGRLDRVCQYPAGGTCASTTNTRLTDYGYDELGRMTTQVVKERFTGSDVTRLAWTTTHNLDGTRASLAFDGTGSAPSQGTDTLTFTYDAFGRPDQLTDGAVVLTDHAWNADGTLASRVDGTVGASSYGYDWANRLTSISPPSSFAASPVTQAWRLDGLLGSRAYPGSATLTAGYDAAKRPTSISAGALGSLTQGFDRGGNVTFEERDLDGVTGDAGTGRQAFAYDALDRLVSSTGLATGDRTYSYDLDGNRTGKTEEVDGVTRTFSAAHDRTGAITTITRTDQPGPWVAQYDAFGNLTGDPQTGLGTTTYAYDAADRLTAIDPAGTSNDTTFGLDALGRHASRTVAGVTETYEFAGETETVTAIGGPTPVASLVAADGARLATRTGTTTRYLVPDPHGNTGALAQGTGLAAALRYDGYGQTIATSPASLPAGTERFKYQGRLDIAPPGLDVPLYEFSARFYAPGLGTFTQADTLTGSALEPLSLNRYLYAHANPATMIDPTGHLAIVEDGVIIRESSRYRPGKARTYRQIAKTVRRGSRTRADVFRSSIARQRTSRALGEGRSTFARDESGRPSTISWRDSYRAAIADMNSHLSDRDIMAEEARTHEDRTGLVSSPWTIHDALLVPSLVPGVGTPADAIDAAAYAAEGDWGNALLNGAAVLPLVDAIKLGKRALGALDFGARHADEGAFALRGADKATDFLRRLPTYRGTGKVSGTLDMGDGRTLDLVSGYKGPSEKVSGIPGMNHTIKSHVEAHAAVTMRLEEVSQAVLYLNKAPCESWAGACHQMLPRMLPDGATLNIFWPGGSRQYIGAADK